MVLAEAYHAIAERAGTVCIYQDIIAIASLAKVGICCCAIVGYHNLCLEPVCGVQRDRPCSLFFKTCRWLPVMRAELRFFSIVPNIELPHIEVAVKTIVIGKDDAC